MYISVIYTKPFSCKSVRDNTFRNYNYYYHPHRYYVLLALSLSSLSQLVNSDSYICQLVSCLFIGIFVRQQSGRYICFVLLKVH